MNPDKTISATSRGIIIHYEETNKNQYLPYTNAVTDIQIHGHSYKGISYQEPDIRKERYAKEFNNLQENLYRKTLYGIAKYSEKEVQALKPFEIALIKKKQQTVWIELNKWKNEIMYNSAMNWFTKHTRQDSPLMKFLGIGQIDRSTLLRPNRKSFMELGIDKVAIAEKLVSLGFLPGNFFELS